MQFYLEDGISDEEAVSLIDLESPKMDLREARVRSMDSDGILLVVHTVAAASERACVRIDR